jgi:hypothetical protein
MDEEGHGGADYYEGNQGLDHNISLQAGQTPDLIDQQGEDVGHDGQSH